MQVVGSLDIFNILNIINILAYLNNPNILNIINILDILNFFFLTFRLLAHLDNDHETEDFVRVEGGTYSSHFIVNEVRLCLFVKGSFIICKQTWDVKMIPIFTGGLYQEHHVDLRPTSLRWKVKLLSFYIFSLMLQM